MTLGNGACQPLHVHAHTWHTTKFEGVTPRPRKLFGKGRIRFDIAIGGLKVWRNCQHHSRRIVNQGEIAALIQLCLAHPTACADIGSCWALCLEALPLKAIKPRVFVCHCYTEIAVRCCYICRQRAIKDY